MERTKYKPQLIDFKKADAILTSDWHLREDTPTCFTGDFQKEQWDAVSTIKALQEIHHCPVIHAGDMFHHWKPSPWLLTMTIIYLPEKFYTIYGQHDLPQHNLNLIEKCGIHNLDVSQKLTVCNGTHYGQTPWSGLFAHSTLPLSILVWHHLTYLSKPFPGAEGGMAEGILRKYSQFDLIVTGDNHQSFTTEYKGRRLVNPGNITRQVADQIDFQPRVALWYAEDNSITWVNLPIQKDVISKEHLLVKQERDERIDAFISKLNGEYVTELSFEENIDNFFAVNDIDEKVKQIIYKAIENEHH